MNLEYIEDLIKIVWQITLTLHKNICETQSNFMKKYGFILTKEEMLLKIAF